MGDARVGLVARGTGVPEAARVAELQSGLLEKRGENAANAIRALNPTALKTGGAQEMDSFCAGLIKTRGEGAKGKGAMALMQAERAFYVLDLGEVVRLWDLWISALPRVHPFYAVKCNPDPVLLKILAALGAGFDVASYAELRAVSAACDGTPPADRIIFANPVKLPSHILAAAEYGVHLSTFDSLSELAKLAQADPGCARAVLRLRVDDPSAKIPLGAKFGCRMEGCRALLEGAKAMGVEVAGVAFHVGSLAGDPGIFSFGVAAARSVFDMAESLGLSKSLTLLDIGGGFTSDGGTTGGASFKDSAAAASQALDEHFPRSQFPDLTVIAEPGRFFAETPFTLAAQVYGKRLKGGAGETHFEYWINDGIYGSMSCLVYDHAHLIARRISMAPATSHFKDEKTPGDEAFVSTVFGPTCDGLDIVLQDEKLPELQVGDWLVFPRMGAYTKAAGSAFNGFASEDIKVAAYIFTPEKDTS